MKSICPIHKIEFGYTCPVCEESLSYVSRSHLILFFREGFLGKHVNHPSNDEERGAYAHGQRLAKSYKPGVFYE